MYSWMAQLFQSIQMTPGSRGIFFVRFFRRISTLTFPRAWYDSHSREIRRVFEFLPKQSLTLSANAMIEHYGRCKLDFIRRKKSCQSILSNKEDAEKGIVESQICCHDIFGLIMYYLVKPFSLKCGPLHQTDPRPTEFKSSKMLQPRMARKK